MTLLSIGIYFIPILLGTLLVHLIWDVNDPKVLLLKFALGIGIGMGLSSLLYFVLLFTHPSWFLSILLGVTFLLGFISFQTSKPFASLSIPPLTKLQKLLFLMLVIVIVADLASFISSSLRRPHGAWDSWAIWNRSARFIYRGGENWQRIFSEEFYWLFHADYPLLVPLTTAWAWDVLNVETLRVPMVQSGIYFFGSGLLLFSALLVFRSMGAASLGTIILMALPGFIGTGSSQLADTPLAIFIAATAIFFVMYTKYRAPRILALAGLSTGLAMWTKNEGIIFLIASLAGLVVMSYKERQAWRLIAWYFGGLLLPLFIVLFYKFTLAPPGDLFVAGLAQNWQLVTDVSRYRMVLNAFVSAFLNLNGWGYGGGYNILSFLLYYLVWKQRNADLWTRGGVAILVMLMIQLFAYFATYILTPHDLEWHLAFSLDRILLHIYPTLLFLLFLVTEGPENIFSPKEPALQTGTR